MSQELIQLIDDAVNSGTRLTLGSGIVLAIPPQKVEPIIAKLLTYPDGVTVDDTRGLFEREDWQKIDLVAALDAMPPKIVPIFVTRYILRVLNMCFDVRQVPSWNEYVDRYKAVILT